ncbi:MAG: dTDP-4-dehydrorhamnose reductase [Muribaculaceae bacterium]
MNILVTGANGQLGNEIRIVTRESRHKYIYTDVVEIDGNPTTLLDITNADDVKAIVANKNIDVIINCAAYTNVDAAEDNEALAQKLNSEAPAILANAMAETGGLLVHISTDYVFGGDPYNTPCREDQKGTPTGVYGATKLRGEELIAASGCKYLIIRTAWLYSEFGKNFVKTMLYLTSTKPQLKVVFDQTGTPTYAYDLAKVIVKIVESKKFEGNEGIYHYSNEGVCSWYDFTKIIAKMAGHTECDIQPCHSSEFPSKVVRPSYSVLDKSKIKRVFGLSIPYWTDSLRICIQNIKQ